MSNLQWYTNQILDFPDINGLDHGVTIGTFGSGSVLERMNINVAFTGFDPLFNPALSYGPSPLYVAIGYFPGSGSGSDLNPFVNRNLDWLYYEDFVQNSSLTQNYAGSYTHLRWGGTNGTRSVHGKRTLDANDTLYLIWGPTNPDVSGALSPHHVDMSITIRALVDHR